ncbi:MAG TPA: alpha/beta fold hydrolase [Chloroflexota bacterium]|jgi:cephalosporin-C deacetylase|nr:alpha/beta fold hydrolase [Chloroflexota bacterium]
MPLEALQTYSPPLTRAADFDEYWQRTLAEARQPLHLESTPIAYPVDGLSVAEVRYDGWRGARIAGYYLAPERGHDLPALVFYHGYSAFKGHIHEYLGWALQGYAVLAVDVRGQSGQSTDPGPYSSGHMRGWMTQGILSPEEYYYRGAYVDCIRALDVISTQPRVNPERIGVIGGSQGGGLTLAVAALDPRPKLAMADIPFLCHFRRALEMTDRDPYQEIAAYCQRYPQRIDQVFSTLSYIDNLNLADRIRCPVLITVGLQDLVCPPSTIFAVYNRITAPKDLAIFPFGVHEIPQAHHVEKLKAARRHLLQQAIS